MAMTTDQLTTELQTYMARKESLLGKEGKFVLIHGADISEPWDTYEDALKAGYDKYGLQPFLVKQIEGTERVQFFTRDICPR
jgi:hypothetical protein